jgi:hypothetical protein
MRNSFEAFLEVWMKQRKITKVTTAVVAAAFLAFASLLMSASNASAEQVPSGSNVYVYSDMFGVPVEIMANWSFKGHRSRSGAEKQKLAEQALETEGRKICKDRGLDYVAIRYLRMENSGSDTKQSWDGKRSHKCWGTGVGHLVIRKP